LLYLKKKIISFILSTSIHSLVIATIIYEGKLSKSETSMTVVNLVESLPSIQIKKKNDLSSTELNNKEQPRYIKKENIINDIVDDKHIHKPKEFTVNSSQLNKTPNNSEVQINVSKEKKPKSISKKKITSTISKNIKSSAKYKIGTIKNPHPEYPMIARKKGWEGKLLLNVHIDKNGDVTNVDLIKTSGFEVLDRTSINTIKDWKFTPASIGGSNVEDHLNIPISFKLIN